MSISSNVQCFEPIVRTVTGQMSAGQKSADIRAPTIERGNKRTPNNVFGTPVGLHAINVKFCPLNVLSPINFPVSAHVSSPKILFYAIVSSALVVTKATMLRLHAHICLVVLW